MDIKQSLLEFFENNPNEYLSGEALAKKLYVSRNAVWKAVRELKEEGYDIVAVTNKGYCMNSNSGILSKQSIEKYINVPNYDVNVYKIVESTNTTAKEAASKGAPEGTVIVAEEQNGGKGRLGRSFFSPKGTGIYVSIVLRPNISAQEALFITAAAAVAVAQAIESVADCDAKIKWVNDIYCNGKKVCGILTEGAVNMETGFFDYAVVGMGVNVVEPEGGFSADIANVAGTIMKREESKPDVKSRLIGEIVNRFDHYYKNLDSREFITEYKNRSFLIGRNVYVIKPDKKILAKAVSLDDDCRLVVEYEDGSREALSTGEVSVKAAEV